jgi:hypothetical protein
MIVMNFWKVFIFLILAFILSGTGLNAQTSFLSSPEAYLGQEPPGDTPKVFAPHLLIVDSGMSMDRSAFSRDGKEFYYCHAMHWFSSQGSRIEFFKFDGNKWNGPSTLNHGYYAPTFSMDEKSMYFLGGARDSLHSIVWISHRKDKGWTDPEVYLKKDYGLYDFMPTMSGVAYVGSNALQGSRRNFQTYNFCTLTFTARDTIVQSLGQPLNAPGFNGDFYMAPDESYMIVSYKEKPDYECELGISFRKPDHSWTVPENLGPLINDGDAHRWGEYVSPDGKYLFYSRGTGEKDCSLHWVRFDSLKEKLRKIALAE